ncbi:uncharacterized protein B0T15DRAFT_135858, partial [Chaetomium strumarium]
NPASRLSPPALVLKIPNPQYYGKFTYILVSTVSGQIFFLFALRVQALELPHGKDALPRITGLGWVVLGVGARSSCARKDILFPHPELRATQLHTSTREGLNSKCSSETAMAFLKRGSEHRAKLRQAVRGLFSTQSGTGGNPSHHAPEGSHTAESHKEPTPVASEASKSAIVNCNNQPTNSEHQAPKPSLWDRAYEALGASDPRLVEEYERLLSEELKSAEHATQAAGTGTPLGQKQLQAIVGRCLERLEEKRLGDMIAQVGGLIL